MLRLGKVTGMLGQFNLTFELLGMDDLLRLRE